MTDTEQMNDPAGQLIHSIGSALDALEHLPDDQLAEIDDVLVEMANRLDLISRDALRASKRKMERDFMKRRVV